MQRIFRLNTALRYLRILLFILTLYFTFLGGNSITDHSLGPRMFHHALMVTIMGGWCAYLLIRRKEWPATPLDLPIVVFLLINVAATVGAVDPRISLEELWRLLGHIFLFYIIVDLMRSIRPRIVIEPLFFASSVVILIGLMEFSSWYTGIPSLPLFAISWLEVGGIQNPLPPVIYRLSFTLLIATHLSAYMATLTPVGLAWAVSSKSRETRQALSVWLIGAIVIEILSFSRGGLVSLGVSLPIFAILSLLSTSLIKERIIAFARDKRVLGAGVVGLVLLTGFALIWSRQTNIGGHRSGDVLRLDLWKSAWNVGLENPILGVGPYGYGRAMRQFRDPEITPDHFITPHNVPLLFWAETGILGTLGLFVMTGTLFIAGLNRWRYVGTTERIRVAGALAALIGFSVQSLFDTFINTTPIMLPAIVLAAYLVHRIEFTKSNDPVRRWIPAVGIVIVLGAGGAWWLSDQAQRQFQTAISLRDSGSHEAALIAIDNARRIDPSLGLYAAQRAQILGELTLSEPDHLSSALDAYKQAILLEDSYDLMQANYAFLLAKSGDYDSALEHFNRASLIRPAEPRYHLWLAEVAARLGNDNLMRQEYREALELSPDWVVSPYWDQTAQRAAERDRYIEETGLAERPSAILGMIPSYCWPPLADHEAFETTDSQALSLACEGWINFHLNSDLEVALNALNQAIDISPTYGPYAWRGEVHFELGNYEAAEQDARYALFYGDSRAHYVLGLLAEEAGELDIAAREYSQAGPLTIHLQGWDVAVYDRRGSLALLQLSEFDAPGASRYDLTSWLALYALYERTGKADQALEVYNAILNADPYFLFDEP